MYAPTCLLYALVISMWVDKGKVFCLCVKEFMIVSVVRGETENEKVLSFGYKTCLLW